MFMVELELFQLGSPFGLKVRQGGGFLGSVSIQVKTLVSEMVAHLSVLPALSFCFSDCPSIG
jgi:hypothetical protein